MTEADPVCRDMRDSMALGQVLQDRFNWSNSCPSASAERKSFENEFRQWTKWNEENNNSSETRSTRNDSTSTSTSPFLKPIPGLPSTSQILDLSSLGLSSSSHSSLGLPRRHKRESMNHHEPPPAPRMNRSFRVFVGWKAND